ncbi:MAG: hypothetical protein A2283_06890 [Lentisphaerae bacterium RIFOXYA12_FULL_48_11]|nr:MAG: hypothetical protein A2283_06890 [Lentisphaerae bacterium RIFOXYA12_FULL_48_11]
MNKLKTSKALLEVWAWKDECYRDVAHLSLEAGLDRRLRDSRRAADSLPVKVPMAPMPRRLIVAESPVTYEVAPPRMVGSKHLKKITNKQKHKK